MTKLLRFLKLWPFHDLVIEITWTRYDLIRATKWAKDMATNLAKWDAENFVAPEVIWDFTDEEKEFLLWEQASDYDFREFESSETAKTEKSAQLDYIR